jgi:hypothetical protein
MCRLNREGEKTSSPLTSQMTPSDLSVAKSTDEGAIKSTTGVAFKESEYGIRFSIPGHRISNITKTWTRIFTVKGTILKNF